MSERMGYNMQEELHRLKSETDKIPLYEANQKFENAAINFFNAQKENEGQQIISSDGKANLRWIFNEETREGRFAIIRPDAQNLESESEPFDVEKEAETVEMLEPFNPYVEDVKSNYLSTNQVREIFNTLAPAFRESLLDGRRQALEVSKQLVKNWQDNLKTEKREGMITELKENIKNEDLAQENLRKQIETLE